MLYSIVFRALAHLSGHLAIRPSCHIWSSGYPAFQPSSHLAIQRLEDACLLSTFARARGRQSSEPRPIHAARVRYQCSQSETPARET